MLRYINKSVKSEVTRIRNDFEEADRVQDILLQDYEDEMILSGKTLPEAFSNPAENVTMDIIRDQQKDLIRNIFMEIYNSGSEIDRRIIDCVKAYDFSLTPADMVKFSGVNFSKIQKFREKVQRRLKKFSL